MTQFANNNPSNNNENKAINLLPTDPVQAVKALIKLSERMVALSERETQVLVQNDLATFSILQNEKETATTRYTRASAEFRKRLREFKGTDQAALNQLENLQRRLGEIAQSNSDIVERMFKRASKKTHESLLTVQELAQKHPVTEQENAATN